jgi:O-6-methylguanine DNA methyltransferase
VFKPFHILIISAKIQKSVKAAFKMAKESAKEVKVTEFQARVYELLSQIPEGRVSTYAEMSKALQSSPRAVGGACRRNPFAPQVPCHRVIQADGVS